MSKILDSYNYLKEKDDKVIYLFEAGCFYISIDEDAKYLNEILDLKLTKLNDYILKCGFPKNSIDKYIAYFKKYNIEFRLIKDNIDYSKIIDKIKEIDLNSITQ